MGSDPMNALCLPAITVSPVVSVESAGGWVGSALTANSAYIDPHLVVLLFLFGFSLLYAALLVLDVASQKRSVDRTPEE